MDAEKYNRSVALLCPTCGSDQFESEKDHEDVEWLKCVSCERVLTKDELMAANSENIAEHVGEIEKEVTKDLAKEVRGTFQKAFRGTKGIRFK